MTDTEGPQRDTALYDPLTELSAPFLVPPSARKYNLQYSSLYDFRLRRLKHPKGRLLAAATRRWTDGILDEDEEDELKQESAATTIKEEESLASTSTGGSRFGRGTSRKRSRAATDDEPLPKAHYVKRILDVKQGEICFVIGTIYCSMHLKPDVLEELTREQWLPPQPPNEHYADPDKDEFFIEDESGRVRLVGQALHADGFLHDALVTGVVVALLGTETRSGDFEVADAIFAGLPAPGEGASSESSAKQDAMDVDEGDDAWVAIVSGLEIDAAQSAIKLDKSATDNKAPGVNGASTEGQADGILGYAEKELRLMMLTDWLLGATGDAAEASRVTSLIIAGNSIAPLPRLDDDRISNGTRNVQSGPPAAKNAYPTSTFDDFLCDVAGSMHVHLLPGQRDPTSLAMPQQPIHFALLPKSAQFSGLHRQTNPAWVGVQGKRFLGTSGQNIDDVFKYMVEHDDAQARLRTACQTLEWGHVAPTAPDTLSCYPFNDRDPFLIEEAPDVYFVGNQDAFATRLYKSARSGQSHLVRVVLVPSFSQTGCVVLVNPKTLACKTVEIGVETA